MEGRGKTGKKETISLALSAGHWESCTSSLVGDSSRGPSGHQAEGQ